MHIIAVRAKPPYVTKFAKITFSEIDRRHNNTRSDKKGIFVPNGSYVFSRYKTSYVAAGKTCPYNTS